MADDAALFGIDGAFHPHAIPLPLTFLGPEGFDFSLSLISIETCSIHS